MNEYVGLTLLIVALIAYLFYFKEKLIKWENRDSVSKSFSIRLIVILVVGIIAITIKIFKNQ